MRDQSNKADNGKRNPLLLLRDLAHPLSSVLAVLCYGVEKYEPRGWRKVEPERYEEALIRHIQAWLGGEWEDQETGLPHLSHAATNCLFLLWFEFQGKDADAGCVYNKPPQDHKISGKSASMMIIDEVAPPDSLRFPWRGEPK